MQEATLEYAALSKILVWGERHMKEKLCVCVWMGGSVCLRLLCSLLADPSLQRLEHEGEGVLLLMSSFP